ncbi:MULTISPECIES: hypothetical protein [Oleiagrimonas]|jgi:hypothetical protein|uniref:Roadblock/LAMTOR2 domain-containing protein n=1 Tax=Oleiagrimonas citrea TaxID=1665687 RepID=A0A846ZLP2_9GAMM|nr:MULTISPECIES: hypothetical protein [Oleiagrimonas]NKZ39124.1 hypothetical protein [Oleiagrimonas citrea]RAP57730.1 hypothetical protein BTJ49_07500 [Oleiagrimonas sp. MCCC 1A03011]
MSNLSESLQELLSIDGAQAVSLVDYSSGMLLGEAGSGIDMEAAAAGNTEVIRAKMRTMDALKLDDEIEDVLISLHKAYHIIRPIASKDGLFLYVVLDRNKSNLALARRKVLEVEKGLEL